MIADLRSTLRSNWRGLLLAVALLAHGVWAAGQFGTLTGELVQKLNQLRTAEPQAVRHAASGWHGSVARSIAREHGVRTVLLLGIANRREFFFLSYYLAPVRVLLGPRDMPVYGEKDLALASLRMTVRDGTLVIFDPRAEPRTLPTHLVATARGKPLKVDDSTREFLERERVDLVAVLLGRQIHLIRLARAEGVMP